MALTESDRLLVIRRAESYASSALGPPSQLTSFTRPAGRGTDPYYRFRFPLWIYAPPLAFPIQSRLRFQARVAASLLQLPRSSQLNP